MLARLIVLARAKGIRWQSSPDVVLRAVEAIGSRVAGRLIAEPTEVLDLTRAEVVQVRIGALIRRAALLPVATAAAVRHQAIAVVVQVPPTSAVSGVARAKEVHVTAAMARPGGRVVMK